MGVSEQGQPSGRYCLIPRTLIFLRRDDQVLLIRGAAHKRLWANRYNGIGGHVERGEDILSAARRELSEETGLSAELHLCGLVTIDTGPSGGIGLYVFSGVPTGGTLAASAEGTLEWVAQSALPDLPLVEDLPILLPRVLAYRPGAAPFSAHYHYDAQDRLQIRFAAAIPA